MLKMLMLKRCWVKTSAFWFRKENSPAFPYQQMLYHRPSHQKYCYICLKRIAQYIIQPLVFIFGVLGLVQLFTGKSIISPKTHSHCLSRNESFHCSQETLTRNGNNYTVNRKVNSIIDFDRDWRNGMESKWQVPKVKPVQNTISHKRKLWMRISDEVFVYSAHLDTRNFSPYFSHSNLSMAGEAAGSGGNNTGRTSQGHRLEEGEHGQYIIDNDKLSGIILVRLIGIKAIPPLREFIKKDILDWFRIKHEMEFSQKFQCKLFYNSVGLDGRGGANGKFLHLSSSKLTYTVIEEGVKIYAGTYFNCYFDLRNDSKTFRIIKENADKQQLQISMYPKRLSDYPNKLIDVDSKMKFHDKSQSYKKGTLGLCVRPIFGPFDDITKLISFIAYYHVVGITQFNFYIMGASTRVQKLLNILLVMSKVKTVGNDSGEKSKRRRLARFMVQDWNLPTGNTSELWDYGALTALNDCLFTNIDQEYVLFVDIDEFIVPQTKLLNFTAATTLSNLGNALSLWNIIDSYDRNKTFQYLIRNTFFCDEFCRQKPNIVNGKDNVGLTEVLFPITSIHNKANSTYNGFDISANLPIFACTTRTKRIWNAALRSKYIVNPRQVLSVGHHLVTKYVSRNVDFRFTPGFSVQVNPDIAIMNHYRECATISSKSHPVLTRVTKPDELMLMFKSQIQDFIVTFLPNVTF